MATFVAALLLTAKVLTLGEALQTAAAAQPQLAQARAGTAAARARADELRAPLLPQLVAQLALERQQVRTDVEQARVAVQAAKTSLRFAEAALGHARERLRLAEERYRIGGGNILELTAYTQAPAQAVQADFNVSSARATLIQRWGGSDMLRFAVELMALIVVYAGLRLSVFKLTRISWQDYHAPVIVRALARRPLTLLALLAPSLPLCATSWSRLAVEPWARGWVALLVACACVFWSTYAVNWYLGRRHLGDRLLLVALGAASIAHPAFVPAFVALSVVLSRQFLYPLFVADVEDVNTYCHKVLVLHHLLAFTAWAGAQRVWPLPASRLLALALVVQGASYFVSATGKLRLRWAPGNDLRGLLTAAVAHGWFRAGDRWLRTWLRFVERTNPLLTVGCLLVELGAGVLLLHRGLTIALLVGLAMLHIAVLVLSGINFTVWSLLDLALAAIAWREPAATFGVGQALVGLGVLVAARRLLRPYELAWIDTQLCNAFRFVGLGVDRRAVELGPEAFAPFDMIVANGKFRFICEDRLLVDAWGETESRELAAEIERLRTAAELRELEGRRGQPGFKSRGLKVMEEFLAVYLRTAGRRAPHALSWGSRDWLSNRRPLATPLEAVAVHVLKVIFAGGRFDALDDHALMTLKREGVVSPAAPAPPAASLGTSP